ncbi:MAG: hypothetical protein QM754_01345 [Tepidisphaeraceae bacterium]
MNYVRRPIFWFAMVVGWLVTVFVLALVARMFGAFEEMSSTQKLILFLGITVLSLLASVMYGAVVCEPLRLLLSVLF